MRFDLGFFEGIDGCTVEKYIPGKTEKGWGFISVIIKVISIGFFIMAARAIIMDYDHQLLFTFATIAMWILGYISSDKETNDKLFVRLAPDIPALSLKKLTDNFDITETETAGIWEVAKETRSLLNSLFHKRETTILCISDLHNGLPEEGISIIRQAVHSCDTIITLGDIPLDALNIIRQIGNEASVPITGVMGNHDSKNVLQRAGIQELSCTEVTEIAGMHLVGLSGTIRYKRGDYAMMEPEEAENIIADMPPAPILISHDCCEKSPLCYGIAHSGMPGLCDYMERGKTAIHIHGHVHKNRRYNVGKTACLSVFGIVKVHLRRNKIAGADVLWRPWNED